MGEHEWSDPLTDTSEELARLARVRDVYARAKAGLFSDSAFYLIKELGDALDGPEASEQMIVRQIRQPSFDQQSFTEYIQACMERMGIGVGEVGTAWKSESPQASWSSHLTTYKEAKDEQGSSPTEAG